jgi:hypothetical protein
MTERRKETTVGKDRQRLHVVLNPKTAEALKDTADRRELTTTEAVRKAIGTWTWLERQTSNGARLQIVEPSGEIREVILHFAD